jgi:hypothetical protein
MFLVELQHLERQFNEWCTVPAAAEISESGQCSAFRYKEKQWVAGVFGRATVLLRCFSTELLVNRK